MRCSGLRRAYWQWRRHRRRGIRNMHRSRRCRAIQLNRLYPPFQCREPIQYRLHLIIHEREL
jgi:hypothetical protein